MLPPTIPSAGAFWTLAVALHKPWRVAGRAAPLPGPLSAGTAVRVTPHGGMAHSLPQHLTTAGTAPGSAPCAAGKDLAGAGGCAPHPCMPSFLPHTDRRCSGASRPDAGRIPFFSSFACCGGGGRPGPAWSMNCGPRYALAQPSPALRPLFDCLQQGSSAPTEMPPFTARPLRQTVSCAPLSGYSL